MRLGEEGFLYQRNKFLRQIMDAPASDKTKLILHWNVEEKNFSTAEFHPKKVHYRINVEEVQKVAIADQVIKYLRLTKNFNVYTGLKRVVLIPTLLLTLLLGLSFWVLPDLVQNAGRLALSLFGRLSSSSCRRVSAIHAIDFCRHQKMGSQCSRP